MASKEIRSCFLGRVSTKLESQSSSLVNQKDLIIKFIQEQKPMFDNNVTKFNKTVIFCYYSVNNFN